MPDSDSPPRSVSESWDTYWRGAHGSAAYTGGGSSHPAVLSFWDDFFKDLKKQGSAPAIIDIASGNGAVLECASRVFGEGMPEFACLDASAAAIKMLEDRFPGVTGIVADAASIPLPSGRFDLVTSQFGVEYAGIDAIGEAARLVKAQGEITLMLHHRGGLIHSQCDANFEAISAMLAADFIPRCIAVFEAGFDALGGGDPAPYTEAGRAFAPSIRALESIMMRHGRDVADGTILKVYRDVRDIHGRMRNYERSDVIGWLTRLQDEIAAYARRMASMCATALDRDAFSVVCDGLVADGFEILRAGPLEAAESDLPIAWVLVAGRP